jgi:cell division septal protein FtsQ
MTTRAATSAGRRRAAAHKARRTAPAKPKAATKPAKPTVTKRPAKPKAAKKPAKPKVARAKARPAAKPTQRRFGKLRKRAVIALVVVAALAAAYLFWFRDSSLVAVDDVTVRGLDGKGSGAASAALVAAAEKMTTLDVDQSRFDEVAARFPEIASVSADPGFPHGMTLTVETRPPVMIARDGGEEVPIAGDGTVLADDPDALSDKLPAVDVSDLPQTGAVTGTALAEARVLGAAPGALRPEIADISSSGDEGPTVKLHGGIELRFGSAGAAPAKWAAAAAVLADRRLTMLSYVDVRVPRRPAVG